MHSAVYCLMSGRKLVRFKLVVPTTERIKAQRLVTIRYDTVRNTILSSRLSNRHHAHDTGRAISRSCCTNSKLCVYDLYDSICTTHSDRNHVPCYKEEKRATNKRSTQSDGVCVIVQYAVARVRAYSADSTKSATRERNAALQWSLSARLLSRQSCGHLCFFDDSPPFASAAPRSKDVFTGNVSHVKAEVGL